MQTDFTVFSGFRLGDGHERYAYRCQGALIRHRGIFYFAYRPMYEEVNGEVIGIQSGLGLSIMPTTHDNMDICRSLISSGGVKIEMTEQPLEDLLGMQKKIDALNECGPVIKIGSLDTLEMRFATEVGHIVFVANAQGSISIDIDRVG